MFRYEEVVKRMKCGTQITAFLWLSLPVSFSPERFPSRVPIKLLRKCVFPVVVHLKDNFLFRFYAHTTTTTVSFQFSILTVTDYYCHVCTMCVHEGVHMRKIGHFVECDSSSIK